MRVNFQPAAGGTASSTNLQACTGTTSMNFYVAGMYPNTAYSMFWQTVSPAGLVLHSGSPLPFTTGGIPSTVSLPVIGPAAGYTTPPNQVNPVILHAFIPRFGATYVIAATGLSGLSGNVIWYSPTPASFLGRNEPGGNILILETAQASPATPNPYTQVLREVDLAGNTVLESNAEIVSEQLTAAGKQAANGFHHEIRRLPNGDILVLAANERLVTNANQCGTTGGNPNTCDLIGDEIVILDANMQYKWSWNSFDDGAYTDQNGPEELSNRAAVLNDVCTQGQTGCPPFFLATSASKRA